MSARMGARRLTFAIAVLAAALLAAAGLGAGAGFWSFSVGFRLFRWAAILGLVAVGLSLPQLLVPRWRGPGIPLLLASLVLGAAAFATPWSWRREAGRVPPIHDITTDPADPPAFVAVLPLRAEAPNPAAYGGPDVAAAQRESYPDVRPLVLPSPPGATFPRALAAARAMGWTVVAADSAAGRIEATATTRWFRFKDDVVVRIRAQGAGSRVDARSVSRVGQSDVGTNARRIRAYLARLAES